MRRIAIMLVAVAVLGVGVTAGPAYAKKDKKSAKITNCKKDKKLDEHITEAFQAFLGGETTADKVAKVQDGDLVAPFVEQGAQANPNPTSKTWVVDVSASCDGKKAATYTYDLAISDATATSAPSEGLGLNFAGDAIVDKKTGTWLITAGTICDLVGQNPATPTAGPECLAAIS